MLNDFDGLTQQLFEKPFRNMLFTIYNFAEEDFYIHNLRNLGYDGDIDELEFISLDAKGISVGEIRDFKNYIEKVIQNESVVVGILLYKGKYGQIVPIAIKPKKVNITDVIKSR